MALDACIDNVFEWYTGDNVAVVTFSQKKWINKFRKYKEEYPNDIKIIAENDDGSIVGKVPVSWIKFSPPRKGRELTEEEKNNIAKRFAEAREKKNGSNT